MIQNEEKPIKTKKSENNSLKLLSCNPKKLLQSSENKIALESLCNMWEFPPFDQALEKIWKLVSNPIDEKNKDLLKNFRIYEIHTEEGEIGVSICERFPLRHDSQSTEYVLCNCIVDFDYIEKSLELTVSSAGLLNRILKDFENSRTCAYIVLQFPKREKTYKVIRKLKRKTIKKRRKISSSIKNPYLANFYVFSTPKDFRITNSECNREKFGDSYQLYWFNPDFNKEGIPPILCEKAKKSLTLFQEYQASKNPVEEKNSKLYHIFNNILTAKNQYHSLRTQINQKLSNFNRDKIDQIRNFADKNQITDSLG